MEVVVVATVVAEWEAVVVDTAEVEEVEVIIHSFSIFK